VIGAARHAGIPGTLPVHAEIGIDIVLAFGRLHEDEVRAGGSGFGEIDIFLIARHVDALHRHGPRPIDCRMRTIIARNSTIKPAASGAGRQGCDRQAHHGIAQ